MKTGKDTIGFLLNDAARLMRKDFERRTRSLGLTRAQWQALFHLARNEGCNQVTLADLLEVEPITLARVVDKLEAERPGRAAARSERPPRAAAVPGRAGASAAGAIARPRRRDARDRARRHQRG